MSSNKGTSPISDISLLKTHQILEKQTSLESIRV